MEKANNLLEMYEIALASFVQDGRIVEAERLNPLVEAMQDGRNDELVDLARQAGIPEYFIWEITEAFGVDYGKPSTTSSEQEFSTPTGIPAF